MNNQKQQSSYGDLHKQKKFYSGDKESYINFLEEQLKKLTDSLVENENLKSRLESIENQVERITEKSDKFHKINKLLQTCVDNQEEDLKAFKDKIYLDIDMKVKVLESKFDVDDKLLNQESNLNKRFNQRQRDFDKIVETFENKIQMNYEEFSTEIAMDLKNIENKVEERMNQIKDDVLFLIKDEVQNVSKDRQIYNHFQELRCSVNEQLEIQKQDNIATYDLITQKTRAQFNDFVSRIEERLKDQEYQGYQNKEDDLEYIKSKKDISDLKYITNLIMEKVEKIESSKNQMRLSQTISQDTQIQRNGSIDKIEKKLANQMSNQFEKLSNIIKQLQDQQFSIEEKIQNIDPRTMYDIIGKMSKTQEVRGSRDIISQNHHNNNDDDEVIEDNHINNNVRTIKHGRNSSNLSNNNNSGERQQQQSQLSDKYSLISERLRQRRSIENESQLQQQQQNNKLNNSGRQQNNNSSQSRQNEQQQQQRDSNKYQNTINNDEMKYQDYSIKDNKYNRESRQIQQQQKQFDVRDSSNSVSPQKENNRKSKSKERDHSQNTDSLNQSIEELLSKRKNLLNNNNKPPHSPLQKVSSPQNQRGRDFISKQNVLDKEGQVNEEKQIKQYQSRFNERDQFNDNQQDINQNYFKSNNINNNNDQIQSIPYTNNSSVANSNSKNIMKQNDFESKIQNKQITSKLMSDSFKRRSFDDRDNNNYNKDISKFNNDKDQFIKQQQNEQKYSKTEVEVDLDDDNKEYKMNEQSKITQNNQFTSPKLQKSSSFNKFDEIVQKNIQNSPNSQRDENLEEHLEQRRERLRKFIQQTEQQLEQANHGLDDKLNKKYSDHQSQSSQQLQTQNSKSQLLQQQSIQQGQSQQQLISQQMNDDKNQKHSQNPSIKFSPYANNQNQFRGDGFYKSQINRNDLSDTFDEVYSESKNNNNNNVQRNQISQNHRQEDEQDEQLNINNGQQQQQNRIMNQFNNQVRNTNNNKNDIFEIGDDSDIMRLNHRIMTAENNIDSFSQDVISRSMSRENKYNKQQDKHLPQFNQSNNNNHNQIQNYHSQPILKPILDQNNQQEQYYQEQQQLQMQSLQQQYGHEDNNDEEQEEEEIQRVLKKYNNTKVNIKDLIDKKREEEKQRKQSQQNQFKNDTLSPKQSNKERNINNSNTNSAITEKQFINNQSPISQSDMKNKNKKQVINNNDDNDNIEEQQYYTLGNKTRDLLNDDSSYDISTIHNHTNNNNNVNQSKQQSLNKNKFNKHQDIQQSKGLKSKQHSTTDINNKSNQKSIHSHQTEPNVQQQSSSNKKDLDSFFYTKGLKYDFNFSNNTSKTKDQSKSFSMIDKVMNNSQKQKK